MGRKSSKKRGGAGWFDPASYDPRRLFASAPAPAPTPPPPSTEVTSNLPDPVTGAVKEGAGMVQNAGKRLKKHFRVDPTSSKEVGRLLGTRKGDRMLGRKRRRTHKRKH